MNTNTSFEVRDRCPTCGKPYFYVGDVVGKLEDYVCTCNSYTISTYPTGWVCPKCGGVYSPTTTECYRCSPPPTYTTVTGTTGDFSG